MGVMDFMRKRLFGIACFAAICLVISALVTVKPLIEDPEGAYATPVSIYTVC